MNLEKKTKAELIEMIKKMGQSQKYSSETLPFLAVSSGNSCELNDTDLSNKSYIIKLQDSDKMICLMYTDDGINFYDECSNEYTQEQFRPLTKEEVAALTFKNPFEN